MVIVGGDCGWWCIVVVVVGGECDWWCIVDSSDDCGR